MGNSSVSLQSVLDNAVTQSAPSPLAHPSGYGTQLALDIGNDTMSDLISERFNWKWNRKIATPITTNSWQQDYPIAGADNWMGWLENADRVDINNSSDPKPIKQISARRDLPVTSYCRGPVTEICWIYNSEMQYGIWQAGVTYYPLVGANPTMQNPRMAIKINGAILALSKFGTTGNTEPVAAATMPEGTQIPDGTAAWIVCAPTSKGFRVYPLPGPTGPVWTIFPRAQLLPPTFATLQQYIDPIPDDQARHFRRGYRAYCFQASPNPADQARFQSTYNDWMKSLLDIRKDADKEQNVYGLIPATFPVDEIYPGLRNPMNPAEPY